MENRALRGKWYTFRGVLLKRDGCMDSAFTDFHTDSPRDCFISEPQRGALEGHGRRRKVNKGQCLDGNCTLGQCEVSEGKMGGQEREK